MLSYCHVEGVRRTKKHSLCIHSLINDSTLWLILSPKHRSKAAYHSALSLYSSSGQTQPHTVLLFYTATLKCVPIIHQQCHLQAVWNTIHNLSLMEWLMSLCVAVFITLSRPVCLSSSKPHDSKTNQRSISGRVFAVAKFWWIKL